MDPEVARAFSRNFASPAFRRSFRNDPINTLSRVGIDVNQIPREQLDILATLSPQELDLLGEINKRVEEAGGEVAADTNGYVVF